MVAFVPDPNDSVELGFKALDGVCVSLMKDSAVSMTDVMPVAELQCKFDA
jgi:hypothetical protein